jgi:hypothetical protein
MYSSSYVFFRLVFLVMGFIDCDDCLPFSRRLHVAPHRISRALFLSISTIKTTHRRANTPRASARRITASNTMASRERKDNQRAQEALQKYRHAQKLSLQEQLEECEAATLRAR